MGTHPHEVVETDEYYEEDVEAGPVVWPDVSQAPEVFSKDEERAATVEVSKKRSDVEKRAAFSRLASSRASAAMDAMRLLGHLANPTQYAWDEVQEATLFDALEMGVKALRRSFEDARRGVAKNGKHLSLRV